jgi:hypothetical protein
LHWDSQQERFTQFRRTIGFFLNRRNTDKAGSIVSMFTGTWTSPDQEFNSVLQQSIYEKFLKDQAQAADIANQKDIG